MSTFKDLTSDEPATMAAVLQSLVRMRGLDEAQIQQLAAEGRLREHFGFAEDATLPKDFVDESEIPAANPCRSRRVHEPNLTQPATSNLAQQPNEVVAITPLFIKQHYSGLVGLLTRQTSDSAVAAEMLNEAIAIAASHLRVGRISEPHRLAGYVYRVAVNLYRNYRREFDDRGVLREDGVLSPQELESLLVGTPRSRSEALELHQASIDKATS